MATRDINGMRDHHGKLPAFSSIGCYPIIYLTHCDNVLCAECANEVESNPDTYERDKIACADAYYEGSTLYCEECNAEIESAYGDPESKDDK